MAVSDPRIGSILDGRYEIKERIASGGMGTVYRAERVKLGRPVAVKFLHDWGAADEKARKRFAVEARAMAKLDHPNCASVLDVGIDEGIPYVVMAFVTGDNLRTLLDRGSIAGSRSASIMRQILLGLAHAHEHGIVHRDIKPANIVVGDKTGVGLVVKVLDFGLARFRDTSKITGTGMAIGTPAYMSPETALPEPVDARSDIYACGVLLFEMLTGRKPFDSEDALDILRMHRDAPVPSLAEVTDDSKLDRFDPIIARAMAKDPDDRFGTAMAFERAPLPPWLLAVGGLVALLVVGLAIVAATAGSGGGDGDADALVIEVSDDLEESIEDIPGVIEVKQMIADDKKETALKTLLQLRRAYPDNPEVPYLLGRMYFDKFWWNDGVKAYRAAIELDERFRTYPPLIKSALRGFIVTPHRNKPVADFLWTDIGDAAGPYLRETAEDHPRDKVRRRAAKELERWQAQKPAETAPK
jgi:serine/threonine-protein kinase